MGCMLRFSRNFGRKTAIYRAQLKIVTPECDGLMEKIASNRDYKPKFTSWTTLGAAAIFTSNFCSFFFGFPSSLDDESDELSAFFYKKFR